MPGPVPDRPLVFLAGDFPPDVGGIQRYACELVRAVVELGRPSVVVAPARPGDAAVDDALGCPVVRVPAGRGKPGLAWSMARALRSALGSPSPPAAVVATKWMPEGPACLLARVPAGVPVFAFGYGREFLPEARRPVRAWLQRRVLTRARLCFAISSYTGNNFVAAGVSRELVRVVYGGVDAGPLAATEAAAAGRELRRTFELGDARLVLTVARLVPRKGHDLVLRALPKLLADGINARYAIVGDGPEAATLRRIAADLGVAERVLFAEEVADADLPAWYAACDVFAMPSRDVAGAPPEGLGLVYFEANAAGKPVIGARTGGVPDAIAHGESGLLVEPEDVAGLAEALGALLRDPARAAEMGRRGQARVFEEFTWRRVAERFLAAVEEALAERPTTRR